MDSERVLLRLLQLLWFSIRCPAFSSGAAETQAGSLSVVALVGVVLLQRLDLEAVLAEGANALEAGGGRAERGDDRDAERAGGGTDPDFVLARGLAVRGIDDHRELAVFQHVE